MHKPPQLRRKPGHEAIVISGENHVYLLAPDLAAGRADAYTVHQVWLTGRHQTVIVGRELDRGTAEATIRRVEKMLK